MIRDYVDFAFLRPVLGLNKLPRLYQLIRSKSKTTCDLVTLRFPSRWLLLILFFVLIGCFYSIEMRQAVYVLANCL